MGNITIPKEVYLTIVAAAVRFANARIPKEEWLEVSGIFIGKNEGDDVIVSETYPIMHQELDKDAVIDQYKWSEEDMIIASDIELEAYERNEFIVGWWHSHPGFKVMMSHIDIRTTLSYQQNNPLAISLVFNPMRLIRQIEIADKKGDPDKQLKNDPGFKIYRLDDVTSGIEASYHPVEYSIEGYDSMEQLISLTQKFIVDVTNLFPKDNVQQTYEKIVNDRIEQLNSLLLGTEEYLTTLTRRGETQRIPDVLENQTQEIQKFVKETNKRIDFIKEFKEFIEYKERDIIIPQIDKILSNWEGNVVGLDKKLKGLAKKF
ncbi:MAG: Mov34/MPN/PAD-1 family protein [Promethearchaeota archaeon]|jgi:proteasome lid subunit RPN8/RPN11